MSARSTTRDIFSRFTLCFFGLAFCVFTWGLQYKLSLYDPPKAVSHEIPKAKLLSKEEQRTTTESPLVKDHRVPGMDLTAVLISVFLPLFLALHLLRLSTTVKRRRDREALRYPIVRASLTAFFFRPPPIPA